MLQSSRLSLAATVELVDAEITAGRGAETGQGLLDLVSVLADNLALRRSLSDSSIAPEAKRGLIESLFGSQVSAAALGVLSAAATYRWANAQDFLTGLETGGVTALAAEAQKLSQLGTVEEELFRFGRLLASDHDLSRALDSQASADAKRTLITDLVGGKVLDTTQTLISQAAAHPRGKRVAEALEDYAEVLAARQQRSVAEVTVAQPLTENQTQRLGSALAAIYGRELVLNTHVDPDVVGGVRVQVGDEVMDGTISQRLSDVRRRLAS